MTPLDIRDVALEQLHESPTNPRQHFDAAKMAHLVESMRAHGVLAPLIVRPRKKGFEIIAGARRYRAAKEAGLATVPVQVREFDDEAVLEIQVIENLQREDVHPLEEAEGYRQLMATKHYDVARIAERVGRSVNYVYDRMKMLSLTKDAQRLFLDGTILSGHAVILARLSPADQDRALGTEKDPGPLFTSERVLWTHADSLHARRGAQKPITARELQGWVDKHVRFDPAAEDVPQLFPETAAVVAQAREVAEKIVAITHEHYVQPEAKTAERIYGPASWKRADGGKKTCAHAVTGVIVAGPGRGQAFKVCVDKKRCTTHWGSEQRKAKANATAATKGGKAGEQRWQIEQRKMDEQRARENAQRARWDAARPAILEALVKRVAALPIAGTLTDLLISEMRHSGYAIDKLPGRGTTADDLVRHCVLVSLAGQLRSYDATRAFPKVAKRLGVDVAKILAAAAPVEKPAPAKAAKKPAKKKARK